VVVLGTPEESSLVHVLSIISYSIDFVVVVDVVAEADTEVAIHINLKLIDIGFRGPGTLFGKHSNIPHSGVAEVFLEFSFGELTL